MHSGVHVPGRQQELAPTKNFEIPILSKKYYLCALCAFAVNYYVYWESALSIDG